MTVVIAADEATAGRVEDCLGRSAEVAAALDDVPGVLETATPAVVLAARPPGGSRTDVLDHVRDGRYCPPWVPVVALDEAETAPGFDGSVSSDDPEAVRATVERCERIREYRAAVEELYRRCRMRSPGESPDESPDLREAYRQAYRRFRDLDGTAAELGFEHLMTES